MNIRQFPWLTDEANLWLQNKIQTGEIKSVLEFGSGSSTIWFLKNNIELVSIEHDIEWFEAVKQEIDKNNFNCEYHLIDRPYHKVFLNFINNKKFDLVLVDGRDRVECVKSSFELVKDGKFLMLDNDERIEYVEVHSILEKWEKTVFEQHRGEKDLCGWIAPHEWRTTLWTRKF